MMLGYKRDYKKLSCEFIPFNRMYYSFVNKVLLNLKKDSDYKKKLLELAKKDMDVLDLNHNRPAHIFNSFDFNEVYSKINDFIKK